MDTNPQYLSFQKLTANEQPPYDLLLLADPSKDLVDDYLKHADVYLAKHEGQTVGVIVLLPLAEDTVEIKNLAVKPNHQGQGIGRYLIENAIDVARQDHRKSICIGTANSSLHQLRLYQSLGFAITGIKRDFFTDNYPEPIYEDGIQAKHMLVLTRAL